MMQIEGESQALARSESGPGSSFQFQRLATQAEQFSKSVFIWPAVLALLFLSIFPLIVSLYISLSRFDIARGGFKLTFIGLNNYRKLLVGSEKTHFLGLFAPSGLLHWLMFGLVV